MTKNLSKIQILKMIKDNDITAKEGYKLLQKIVTKGKNMEVSEADASNIICFKKIWKDSGIIRKTEKIDGNTILFVPEHIELLDDYSLDKIYIKAGKEYRIIRGNYYEINPSITDDYIHLTADLYRRGLLPQYVIYGWGLKDNVSQAANNYKESDIEEDVFSKKLFPLFNFLKAIIGYELPIQVLYPFYDGESQESLIGKASASLNKSLQLNYNGIRLKSINLQNENLDWQNIIDICFAEVNQFSNQENSEIKIQYGKRYISAMAEVKESTSNEMVLKEKGTYIITGGLGSLGFIFASYFAKEYKANLVLIGRSKLDKYKKEKIEILTSLGGTVLYTKADVGNIHEMQQAIKLAKERFNNIDGCIHAAGTMNNKLFKDKNISEIEAELEGKIKGVINLDYITRFEQLDFFVSFASISSVLGDIGQVDYGFANNFLNAFSEYRNSLQKNGMRQGKTISINWPLWREGGMHIDEECEKLYLSSSGIEYLDNIEGIKLFKDFLNMDCIEVYIIKGKNDRIKKIFNIYEDKEIKTSQISNINLEQLVVNDILNIAVPIIDIDADKIQIERNVGEYGFDSITLKELANNINEKFGTNINASIFFSKSNIKALSIYLCSQYNELIQQYYGENCINEASKVEDLETEDKKPEGKESVVTKQSKSKAQISISTSEATEIDDQSIAIIGISGTFPGSKDLNEFWSNLITGKNLITKVPQNRWSEKNDKNLLDSEDENANWGAFIDDVDKFDADFFGITSREAECMDPQHRIYLENVWKAIEDSGYRASALDGKKIGVFTGIQFSDYRELIKDNNIINVHVTTGNAHAMISNRISYMFNLHGPSEAIDTACSSSLVAINNAIRSIQTKECEMAIAGGVSMTFSQYTFLQASKLGILSQDGKCKTFDKDANGYVKGEGVGVLILKPFNKAVQDGDNIHAIIKGIGINHGGRANTLTAPNAEAQTELLLETYERSKVDINTISYIETHGTGTKLGDPVEVEALKSAFNRLSGKNNFILNQTKHCGLGSVKTNIGHLEPAAGVAGIIKVILAMKHKTIPANLNFNEINPYIQLEKSPFYIVDKSKSWEKLVDNNDNEVPRRAGISCFGFGGTNAHIILEEYIDSKINKEDIIRQKAFVLSAKTKDVLKKYAESIYNFILKFKNNNDREYISEQSFLDNLAYTLQQGREAMEERFAFTFLNMEDLLQKLSSFIEGKSVSNNIFVGSKDKNKIFSEVLSDEDGRSYIRTLIEKNMMSKLLQLWVVGVEFEWNLLYENIGYKKKISLPVYPFDKKSYWFDSFKNSCVQNQQSTYKEKNNKSISLNNDIYEETEVSLELLPEGIAIITIEDRKNKNMFSRKVIRGLKYQFQQIEKNSCVKTVIVRGYENVFCMGGTKEELISLAEEELSFTDEPFLYKGLLECKVPVISMMSGHAFGGGFVFGMFADIVLLASESIYSANFMKYGFTPGLGATYILKEKLGSALAMEMMYTAKQFEGKELKDRGVSLIVKDRSELYEEALAIAKELSEKPIYALNVLKQQLSGKIIKDLQYYLESEQLMHQATFTRPEVKSRIEQYFPKDSKENTIKEKNSKKITLKQNEFIRQKNTVTSIKVNENILSEQAKIIEDKLVSISGYVLHVNEEEIDRDCAFKEMGIDSISCVEITRKISKELNTSIDVTEFYDYPNIRELANYISHKQGVTHPLDNESKSSPSKILLKNKNSKIDNLNEKVSNNLFEKKIQLTHKEEQKENPKLISKEINEEVNINDVGTCNIKEVLIKIVAGCLHVMDEEIDIHSPFKEMGVDSIMGVEIIREINKQFKVKLDSVELYDYSNISGMSEYIFSLVKDKESSLINKCTKGVNNDTLTMLYQLKDGTLDIELADAWLEDKNESD